MDNFDAHKWFKNQYITEAKNPSEFWTKQDAIEALMDIEANISVMGNQQKRDNNRQLLQKAIDTLQRDDSTLDDPEDIKLYNAFQRQQKGLDPLDENLFDTSKPIPNQNIDSLYDEKKAVLDSLYREGQMYLNTNMLTREMLDKLIEWIEDIKMTDF
jgi:hypothetical protein